MDHSTHSSKRTDRAALPQAEASRAELEHGNNALTEDGVPAEHFARVRGPVSKLKHILHLHKVKQDAGDSGDLPVLANVQDTSESKSSRSRLDHEDTHSQSKSSKVHDLLHDPIKATKSTIQDLVAGNVAENMLATEIPHDHDVNLIESQDAVLQAKTSEDRLKATYKRDELVENRQNEFVRWTLDRHVTRVKVVSNDALPDRQKKDYQRTDKQGRVKTDWMSYCAHIARWYAQRYGRRYVGYANCPPPTTERVITASIERIMVASDPLQHFVMGVRRIYRWENPIVTLLYLLLFLLCWAIDLLLPIMLIGIIALVVRRGGQDRSIEELRQKTQHIESMSRRSDSFADFIEKRGSIEWLAPLGEALGPPLLVQLGDVANCLEVFQNFCEWRSPAHSVTSIGILLALTIITTLTPTWLLVKSFTLGLGFMFFALFPISSHYPDYRLLVSPKTWLLWNIPTHAEWAISTIKDQATVQRTRARKDSASDFGQYSCVHAKHMGHLVLGNTDVRFETSVRSAEHWKLSYESILRMEKATRMTHVGSGQDLKFSGVDGAEYTVENVSGRDEAFSQIIGYTDLTWLVEW